MLRERLQSYANLNRDVTALFTASDNVNAREFEVFVKSAQARKTHPGRSYIGYLPRVAMTQVAQFEADVRSVIPSYTVHGNLENADAVYPLLYAFPLDATAKRFIGFDYATVTDRRDAMQKAADSGESVATRKLAYLSASSSADYIFVFTPVYDPSSTIDSPARRREALSGFVFSVFLTGEVIEGIMGPRFGQQFDLEIYDGALKHEQLIYDGDRRPQAIEGDTTLTAYTETIDFAGRRWILHLQPKSFYTARYASRHGWLILLSGGLASLCLAWLTWKRLQQHRARRQQADHAQRFQAVFEHHPSAVFSLDTQWQFINANSQVLQQLQLSRSKLLGSSILDLVTDGHAIQMQAILQEVLSGVSGRFDSALVSGDGQRIDVSIVLIPVITAGQVTSVLGIADNITERRQSEWRLEESRQMLRLVIDNIPQRVFWKNTELYYAGCNKAFCADAGLNDPQDIIGKTDSDFAWKDDAESYRRDDLQTMQDGIARINYEEPQHRRDGDPSWLMTSKIPLSDGHGHAVGVLGMYEDITERKRMEQRLEHMALYDSLTGLPNRTHFLAHLEQAIDKAERFDTLIALMYFDIDKFKRINDTYGHDVGDEVIVQFAARVKGTVRQSDVVGRLGGDEFCLVIESLSSKHSAHKLAVTIVDSMRPAMQVGETTLDVGTSIGIAYHRPGMTADEIIRSADQAMYLAKQAGGNQFKEAQDDVQPA